MIIVRISGWSSGTTPDHIPASVMDLLRQAGIDDKSEIEQARRRLQLGKSVDAYFDLGEHRAARAFMTDLASVGLKSELYDEDSGWLPKSDPRILKILAVCLALTIIVALMFIAGLLGTRLLSAYFLLLLLFIILVLPRIDASRPRSEDQRRKVENLRFWMTPVVIGGVLLISGIITNPWLGVVILILAGGSGLSFLVIRTMNRRS